MGPRVKWDCFFCNMNFGSILSPQSSCKSDRPCINYVVKKREIKALNSVTLHFASLFSFFFNFFFRKDFPIGPHNISLSIPLLRLTRERNHPFTRGLLSLDPLLINLSHVENRNSEAFPTPTPSPFPFPFSFFLC